MQTNKALRIAIAALLPTTAGLWCAQSVHAAGFALLEQNSSGLGNAYAGAGAVSEDASTIFFNSAGLTQLKRPSLVLNAAAIKLKSEFNNAGSAPALGQSLGSTGGDSGDLTIVPALYLAVPLTDRLAGGVGVNAPFGLKTEYDDDWMGRFQAVKSDVKTININTALAFKVHDKVSVGIGADYQTIDATLTKGVNYTAVVASVSPALIGAAAGLQGSSGVKGTDSAWGFDVGVLFTPTDSTKLGLSYRSAIKYSIDGNAVITAPSSSNGTVQAIINGARASTLADGPVNLKIKLPASARAAVSQKLGSAVELLGEVSWMQWSSIEELRIVRPNGVTLSNTPENWDNTWRYALGANWQVKDGLKLRAGVAFDQSPVPDATRTPRLPDNDRTWLSLGAKLDVTKNVALDFGYTHLFAKDGDLNQNDGNANLSGLLLGTQQTKVDILGVQATVSF